MSDATDLALFRFLNGLAGRSAESDAFIVFGATYLPFLMAALALAYVAVAWKTTHFEGRFENLTHAVWACLIGFAAQAAIGFFWFRLRPFAGLEGVIKLADRLASEKSFPSAHATYAFSLAFAIFFHNRKWGSLLLVLAAAVSVSRVMAGVHYPSDVIGGAAVGLVAAGLAAPAKKAIEPYLEFLPAFRKYKRNDV